MESGHTHSCGIREFFDVQRLGEVRTQPGDGSRGSLAQVAARCDRPETARLRGLQEAIDNLALQQRTEEWDVLWSIQKVQQPIEGCKKPNGRVTNRETMPMRVL